MISVPIPEWGYSFHVRSLKERVKTQGMQVAIRKEQFVSISEKT